MKRLSTRLAALGVLSLGACLTLGLAPGAGADGPDEELAADLKLLQGRWELLHGDRGQGPTLRSVKTYSADKKETVQRYDAKTGKLMSERSGTFTLSKGGAVRVMTFHARPGDPGMSYVYKVDKDNFYDVPGLLYGTDFRNYQAKPTVWHWKRMKDEPQKDKQDKQDK